jgi:hypothetical protein
MAAREASFAIGIDLGTTNTVLAFAPLAGTTSAVVHPVEQRISADQHEARDLVPSYLAFDPAAGAWEVGAFARACHERDPESAIASSKSWLTEPRVDRSAAFLPLATDLDLERDEAPRLSPADAQALLLRTLERSWNAAHPDAPFASQAIVVTIPASFDPFARDLVLHAARAIAPRATLLEEPTAALLHAGTRLPDSVQDALTVHHRVLVLVADIGGGTTDFALVRILRGVRGPVFERVATGRHLLLGGDNLDLALAHRVAEVHEPLRKIAPRAFATLVSECRRAKETLLGDHAIDEVEVRVLLPGSKLIGGLRTGLVTRAMIDACVLHEFFPMPDELAPKPTRSAFMGFGLSYERDPAITRHAWEFLERHRDLVDAPVFVLPNGGTLKAPVLVDRLVEALRRFGFATAGLLPGDAGDVAVALGAARHAKALAEGSSQLRGKAPRNWFLRVDRAEGSSVYVAIVAAGSSEGEEHRVQVDDLVLRTGERARFELAWTDGVPVPPGTFLQENIEPDRLPPLTVAVPSGRYPTVPVTLRARLDDLGCVHLVCESSELAAPLVCTFETRARGARGLRQARLDATVLPLLEAADVLLADAFPSDATPGSERYAKDLWRTLESRFGPRKTWTLSFCRGLFDAALGRAKARRRSADHERVFWQLAGFALRPGMGADGDEERIDRLFKLEQERVAYTEDARVWEAYFHAWRRCALGVEARRQGVLFDRAELALGVKKQKKSCPHAFDASLAELAGSLDRVVVRRRAALGDALFDRCMAGEGGAHVRRCLGLLGERDPFPAGHDQALPALVVERWCDLALRENWTTHPAWIDAVGRMARRTGDRRRDVSEALRERLLVRLAACGDAAIEARRFVAEGGTPSARARLEAAGDDLPLGLVLDA